MKVVQKHSGKKQTVVTHEQNEPEVERPNILGEATRMEAQRAATNERVENLKMQLTRMTDRHMDHAMNLVRSFKGSNK